jgi:uncharacterized protein YjbJ (UPF0337 family)
MGDRKQRLEGKAQELKGRVKREAGIASENPGTELRGAAEQLKGKLKKTIGNARSEAKKHTR